MMNLFEEDEDKFPNLPTELIGLDLKSKKLEKINTKIKDEIGSNVVIHIGFKKYQSEELARFLGLPKIDTDKKTSYSFEELRRYKKYGLL